jgi:hypothetical protein
MMRCVGLFCVIVALAAASSQYDRRFAQYKAINAYETGSGILVLPRYSSDGLLCEVTLEKQHYLDDTVDLGSALSHDKIIEVVNSIAPVSERGKSTTPFGTEYLSKYDGNSVTTFADYEAVSIQIYGRSSPAFDAGDIAARIRWNKRVCK